MLKGMRASVIDRRTPIAAIDIGTSKVACLISNGAGMGHPRVIGTATVPSTGIDAGAVVDMEAAEAAIAEAVRQAEQAAQLTVTQAVVSISAGLDSFPVRVIETLDGDTVAHKHILGGAGRIANQLGQDAASQGLRLVHVLQRDYELDGTERIQDPIGMSGQELTIHALAVVVTESVVATLRNCVARCAIEPIRVIASPVAGAALALSADDRTIGSAYVDLGGGTTTACAYARGLPTFVGSIALGGEDVTRDIASGLEVDLRTAEILKCTKGSLARVSGGLDAGVKVGSPDGPKRVQASILTAMMRPRIEEVVDCIYGAIDSRGQGQLVQRITLSGGTSQTPGLREVVAAHTQKTVRKVPPATLGALPVDFRTSEMMTALGLLEYAYGQPIDYLDYLAPQGSRTGILGRVVDLLLK